MKKRILAERYLYTGRWDGERYAMRPDGQWFEKKRLFGSGKKIWLKCEEPKGEHLKKYDGNVLLPTDDTYEKMFSKKVNKMSNQAQHLKTFFSPEIDRTRMINRVCGVLYQNQGYDCEDEIDLADATHPQEIAIYNQAIEVIDAIIEILGDE